MADLIPGLPEDVARECLLRVGFRQLPTACRTSRRWKAEVESPLYSRLRRDSGLSRPLLALVQALPPLSASGPARKYAASAALSSSYRLVLHDPADGGWTTLPPLPGGAGLPLFCQLATVSCRGERRKLVVLGGWDPETWTPTDAVHVYDFLEGAWHRGAPMPGPRRRSFFACAAAGGRVFVAGGHDEEKNALRSAAAYDAEADAWAAMPDMAMERDEARGVCVGGRFVVVGGYPTEAQGRFTGTGEAFDTAAWAWDTVQERVVEEGACPVTCCAAPSAAGPMYMLRDGDLVARDSGSAWRSVARVPEDGRAATAVVAIGDGRVVVVGAGRHGGEQAVYVLTEENGTAPSWARSLAPPEFAGHVQSACCIEV